MTSIKDALYGYTETQERDTVEDETMSDTEEADGTLTFTKMMKHPSVVADLTTTGIPWPMIKPYISSEDDIPTEHIRLYDSETGRMMSKPLRRLAWTCPTEGNLEEYTTMTDEQRKEHVERNNQRENFSRMTGELSDTRTPAEISELLEGESRKAIEFWEALFLTEGYSSKPCGRDYRSTKGKGAKAIACKSLIRVDDGAEHVLRSSNGDPRCGKTHAIQDTYAKTRSSAIKRKLKGVSDPTITWGLPLGDDYYYFCNDGAQTADTDAEAPTTSDRHVFTKNNGRDKFEFVLPASANATATLQQLLGLCDFLQGKVLGPFDPAGKWVKAQTGEEDTVMGEDSSSD